MSRERERAGAIIESLDLMAARDVVRAEGNNERAFGHQDWP